MSTHHTSGTDAAQDSSAVSAKDAHELIAIAQELRMVQHWAAQGGAKIIAEIAGRMLSQPVEVKGATLTRQQIVQGFKSYPQYAYGAFEDGVRCAEQHHGVGAARATASAPQAPAAPAVVAPKFTPEQVTSLLTGPWLTDVGARQLLKGEFHSVGLKDLTLIANVFAAQPAAAATAEGMPVSQEPKYGIRDNRLYNRASGEFIPADEPVFIFRARDAHAVNVLAGYAREVLNDDHAKAVWARVEHFKRFWDTYPERMKQPDTTAVDGEKGGAQ